jgi:hypothetical protein
MDSRRPRLAGNPHAATIIYMSLRFALAIVLCLPTLLSAAVTFGPERALVSPRTVVAEGSQVNASVASSGTETLVAWIDITPGREGIYVAALSESGALVPGSQRRLGTGATSVTITWTGQSYLVLWSRSGGGIFATTLDRDRRALLGPDLVLPDGHVASAVEWAGGRGMFVYVTGVEYRLALIGRDGLVTRSAIAIPASSVNSARVFSDGEGFLAIWDVRQAQTADVYAARYTSGGDLRDATPVKLATAGQFSGTWEAAYDGSRFVLAVAEAGATGSTLRRYVIDPVTLATTTLPAVDMGEATGVRLDWNGSRFIAYWLRNAPQSYELQTLTFTAAGAGDATPVTATMRQGTALQPSGAWNGQALVVAWAGTGLAAPDWYDVYVAAVADGADLSPSHFPIALSPTWQRRPAVAGNGSQSLIAWLEGLDEDTATLAVAHATGGRIDSAPVYLSDNALGPAEVVFTGSAYLVFWRENTGNVPRVVMRRLDVGGSVVDPQETFIANSDNFVAAFNGTHVLVAYSGALGAEAMRFEADGTLFDSTPFSLPGLAAPTAIASNGSDFAVVWQEGSDWWQFPTPNLIDVYAAVISGNGAVLNARIPVAATAANEQMPVIASNGRDFVIAYLEGQRLMTKKLLREGTVIGGAVVDTATELEGATAPFIAASEEGYLAGWELVAGTAASIRLARLDANGAVLDAAQTVAGSGIHDMFPRLASGDLVYARLQDDDTYGASMRIFLRRLGETGGSSRGRAVRH